MLAWLSANSSKQAGGNSGIGEDGHEFSADDTEHYCDAADNAFETLAPSIRTAVKSLVNV